MPFQRNKNLKLAVSTVRTVHVRTAFWWLNCNGWHVRWLCLIETYRTLLNKSWTNSTAEVMSTFVTAIVHFYLLSYFIIYSFQLKYNQRNVKKLNNNICMKWEFSKGTGSISDLGGRGSQGEYYYIPSKRPTLKAPAEALGIINQSINQLIVNSSC